MRIPCLLSDGSPAVIQWGDATARRLADSCFRGRDKVLAGNFSRWVHLDDFADDTFVRTRLLDDALQSADELGALPSLQRRLSFTYPEVVGWDSTAPRAHFRPTDLEPFSPNRWSAALRVRPDRMRLRAPRTNLITVTYEFRCTVVDGFIIHIWTVYPGVDIGALQGNVTRRENRVFFDWNHPGA